MQKDYRLGDFEADLIAAILTSPKGKTYGSMVHSLAEEQTGRRLSLGAVYTTLDRLEKKGLVSSWFSEPIRERGGRSRRHFRIEAAGAKALREKQRVLQHFADALPALSGG